ncbi:MAG: Hsp33 family molecular chaperone HslO [Geminicoccaceae bacterium]|nr:Hsp33 family molecular chaperone HslO [Geminicoccaceae bacterium]
MSARLIADDTLRPFQLERSALRGRLVRLGPAVDTVLTRHDYPDPVSRQLGELLILAATLAGALKFDGTFSLQVKSQGAIRLMVADCTNDGEVRGYAQYDGAAVDRVEREDVPRLFGSGHLALTVQQRGSGESYQGIVELVGVSLTECMQTYFRQSEQVPTGLRVAVGRVRDRNGEGWRAGGIVVQRLPEEGGTGALGFATDEDWRRTMMLLSTATKDELIDPDLPLDTLLFRLFHEEGVRVFQPTRLSFGCRCSKERVETMLRMFDDEQLDEMKLDDGSVLVTCQFCNQDYHLDEVELARLRDASVH